MKSMSKILVALFALATLGGCSMGAGKMVTPSVVSPPDQHAFVFEMNEEERETALAQFSEQRQAELQLLATLYQQGYPISNGKVTTTFQPMLGLVEVNFDHRMEGIPEGHSGKMVFPADQYGRLIGNTDQKTGDVIPEALFANAATGRTSQARVMEGVFGIAQSTMQGAVASAIHAEAIRSQARTIAKSKEGLAESRERIADADREAAERIAQDAAPGLVIQNLNQQEQGSFSSSTATSQQQSDIGVGVDVNSTSGGCPTCGVFD